jgi:hypothetical protein
MQKRFSNILKILMLQTKHVLYHFYHVCAIKYLRKANHNISGEHMQHHK